MTDTVTTPLVGETALDRAITKLRLAGRDGKVWLAADELRVLTVAAISTRAQMEVAALTMLEATGDA